MRIQRHHKEICLVGFAASLVGFNFMVALSDPVDSSDSSDQEVEVQEVKKDEEARKNKSKRQRQNV